MTYDNLALALIFESTYNVEVEIDNFNKICESINILNENNILLEGIDINKFKEKIKKIIDNIREKIKKFIEKIKDIINAIKQKLRDKAFKNAKSKSDFTVNKPTNTLFSDIDRLLDVSEEILRYKNSNFNAGIEAAFNDIPELKNKMENNIDSNIYFEEHVYPKGTKIESIYDEICDTVKECDDRIKKCDKIVSDLKSHLNNLSEEEINNNIAGKFNYIIIAVNYTISILTKIDNQYLEYWLPIAEKYF